jgi:putative acetyltransferase
VIRSVDRGGADVRVRPERSGDEAGVRAVHKAAFGRPDEADLVAALRESRAWLPGFCFVAESAGEVVGHVVLSRLHVGEATSCQTYWHKVAFC